jgi:hypothetical protein
LQSAAASPILSLSTQHTMDEQTKQQVMVGVVFFNFTLIGYMIYRFLIVQNIFVMPVNYGQFFTHLLIGAGIAIIPGIVGYFVGRMMYR